MRAISKYVLNNFNDNPIVVDLNAICKKRRVADRILDCILDDGKSVPRPVAIEIIKLILNDEFSS